MGSITRFLEAFGQIAILSARTLREVFRPPFELRLTVAQLELGGVDSWSITMLMCVFYEVEDGAPEEELRSVSRPRSLAIAAVVAATSTTHSTAGNAKAAAPAKAAVDVRRRRRPRRGMILIDQEFWFLLLQLGTIRPPSACEF